MHILCLKEKSKVISCELLNNFRAIKRENKEQYTVKGSKRDNKKQLKDLINIVELKISKINKNKEWITFRTIDFLDFRTDFSALVWDFVKKPKKMKNNNVNANPNRDSYFDWKFTGKILGYLAIVLSIVIGVYFPPLCWKYQCKKFAIAVIVMSGEYEFFVTDFWKL